MAIIMIPLSLAACVAAGAWNGETYERFVALAFCGAISVTSFHRNRTLFSLSARPMQALHNRISYDPTHMHLAKRVARAGAKKQSGNNKTQ
mmetsp:Transcript_2443/g.4472  ORF Transcript_2443/g.4472 Transcript_2443/m.4472 type:complete len:91 (+) Transcript_2443:471-743(+)